MRNSRNAAVQRGEICHKRRAGGLAHSARLGAARRAVFGRTKRREFGGRRCRQLICEGRAAGNPNARAIPFRRSPCPPKPHKSNVLPMQNTRSIQAVEAARPLFPSGTNQLKDTKILRQASGRRYFP